MPVRRVGGWIPFSIFLLSFVFMLFGMFQQLNPFDEGFILAGAERVLHGAVPYRDFAAYYAPGQLYTLAAIFHVFGSSILVERVWDTLVRFGICVLVFLVARRLVPGRIAWLSFFITLLFLGSCGYFGYPVVPAMFCALASIFLLTRKWPENPPRNLVLAGLAAALSAFYRQDVGAYAFVGGAGVLLIAGTAGWQDFTGKRATSIERLNPLLWYGLGASLIGVPAIAYFLAKVPAGQLWADFMKLPRLQLRFRRIPLPPIIPSGRVLFLSMAWDQAWLLLYVPVAVFAITAVQLVRGMFRPTERPETREQQFAKALLTLFGLLLLVTTVTRADPIHCLPPTIPAAILIVPLLEEWLRLPRWKALPLAVCMSVLAITYVASPIIRWGINLREWEPWGHTSSLPRARLFYVPDDQAEAIRFIQAHVPENQAIFVGNTQHRNVFANDAMFYFLAARQSGTRYEEFEPGVVTTAPVQEEMVQELLENRVRWVILFSGFESKLRQMPANENGATVLDDFLQRDYRKVETFGRYTVLEKRAGSDHTSAMVSPKCSGTTSGTHSSRCGLAQMLTVLSPSRALDSGAGCQSDWEEKG